MLTNEQIDTIHRLHFVEKWTIRKIAKHLHIGRRSIAKYLSKPVQTPLHRTRTSKLDSFKPAIEEWLQQDASVRAAVIFQSSVTIYDQHHEIVRYPRCWRRGQTLGAERFQKELFALKAAAERSAAQHRLVALLGPASEEYLRRLATTDRSLTRQVRELLTLIREYGPDAVATALAKAHAAGAFGADYIANILRQQQSRRNVQPPLCLKDPALNQLATDPLSLAEYDAFILRSRKESHELTTSKTDPSGSDDDEPQSGSGSD